MKTYKLTYYRQVAPSNGVKEELEIPLVDKSSAQKFLNKKFPFNKTRLISVERIRLKSDKKEAYYTSKENQKEKKLKKAEDYKATKEKKHAKNLIYLEKKQKKEKLNK